MLHDLDAVLPQTSRSAEDIPEGCHLAIASDHGMAVYLVAGFS